MIGEISKKIDGFDRFEVESGADTLIRAKEICNRPKFYATVRKELIKRAKAAQEAALEAKVGKKLRSL
ncbi:MAG TPA: hypothetical protein VMW50_08160 [Dehalococcoidia bacterium]|nr:hypothetical protein [Dehalococcoidia bacterium]